MASVERAGHCVVYPAWFAAHGLTIRRVRTDNAKAYRIGRAWIAACTGQRFTSHRGDQALLVSARRSRQAAECRLRAVSRAGRLAS